MPRVTFQHYMNATFHEFLDKFLIIYLDDMLIYSDTLAEHCAHVRLVLERLRAEGLCLKPSKCQFHIQEVAFLGFLVGPEGLRMDPVKVEVIRGWQKVSPDPDFSDFVKPYRGLHMMRTQQSLRISRSGMGFRRVMCQCISDINI